MRSGAAGARFHRAEPRPGAPEGPAPYLALFAGDSDLAARELEARWLARQVAQALATLGERRDHRHPALHPHPSAPVSSGLIRCRAGGPGPGGPEAGREPHRGPPAQSGPGPDPAPGRGGLGRGAPGSLGPPTPGHPGPGGPNSGGSVAREIAPLCRARMTVPLTCRGWPSPWSRPGARWGGGLWPTSWPTGSRPPAPGPGSPPGKAPWEWPTPGPTWTSWPRRKQGSPKPPSSRPTSTSRRLFSRRTPGPRPRRWRS